MTQVHEHGHHPPQGPGHYSDDGQQWYDEAHERWLPVTGGHDTLVVEVEDVSRRGWWVGLLATLTSTQGAAYARFVGRARSHDPRWPTYTIDGPTFARVRGVPDDGRPHEDWAPGMGEALGALRTRLREEGWRLVDRGAEPWQERYERPCVAWPDG
jgi:hypothetical protein